MNALKTVISAGLVAISALSAHAADISGRLIEFGQTAKLFTAPTDSWTQDYVTGRFG